MERRKDEKTSRQSKKVLLAFACLAIFLFLSNIHVACEFKNAEGAGHCLTNDAGLPATEAELIELKKFSVR
jgi:hypothetical protein